jgi:ParB family chromosome partitioning protein
VEEKKVLELKLDDILPNRFQPRIKFDENAINELAGSIKEHGVIQPILVREIGDKYEIIAGERRYKASVLAGKETIPAIINNLNDRDSAEVALIENIQRKDLTPIEEAISYKKILDMGYLNQESLATKLDRTQSTISNKLRLLNLDEEVQEALLNNQISERHARSLLRLDPKEQQKEMLNRIIKERLTVRKTDKEIDKLLNTEESTEKNLREDIFMNKEEPKGIFNIPSSPIIEEIEIFDEFDPKEQLINPASESLDSINEQETDFKPGFLDIDKIEQNAEEINVEKPPVDFDSLLKVDEEFIDEKPEEPKDNEDSNLISGKFFSFISENDNQEATPDNYFDNFNFDLTSSTESNFDSIENNEANENKIDNIESSETIFSEINNTDVFDTPKTENNEVSSEETTILNNNTFTAPDYNFNFDDLDNSQNNQIFDSNSANIYNDDYKVDYTIPGVNDTEINENATKSFNEVLNEIREYSKKIENLGFYVDLDELDFGDSYHITFKINKNE